MKNLLVVVGIVFAFTWIQAEEAQPKKEVVPRRHMLGGYQDVSVTNMNVIKAAEFAVQARQRDMKADGMEDKVALVKIVSASRAVVAGSKYKLNMQVKEGEADKTVEAVVYVNLSHDYFMQSWVEPLQVEENVPSKGADGRADEGKGKNVPLLGAQ